MGVPVAMVSALYGLPINYGVNRVVQGVRIEHVCGNPRLSPEKDNLFMRGIVRVALKALQTPVTGPTLFEISSADEGE